MSKLERRNGFLQLQRKGGRGEGRGSVGWPSLLNTGMFFLFLLLLLLLIFRRQHFLYFGAIVSTLGPRPEESNNYLCNNRITLLFESRDGLNCKKVQLLKTGFGYNKIYLSSKNFYYLFTQRKIEMKKKFCWLQKPILRLAFMSLPYYLFVPNKL